MSRSAADIVLLSSTRETLFIGPAAAFPVLARKVMLRDRLAIRDALRRFLSRPGAEEMVRPYLRRWGIDALAMRVGRTELADILALAIANGAIALALAEEPVVAFARTGEDFDSRVALTLAKGAGNAPLPDDFLDRLFIVAGMVPDHMEGAVKQEFEALIENGYAALLISLVAMMIPGVNLAILGMSLFTLPGQILEAIDKLVAVLGDVREAKTRKELEGAAIIVAAVLAILLREGILRRFLSAKFVAKGMAAVGNRFRKPTPVKKEVRKPQPKAEKKAAPSKDTEPVKASPGRYKRPEPASMSDLEAREWYIAQEKKIPEIIDKSQPLEIQAKQAFGFRNEIRTAARDAMKNRKEADRLMREERNMTWEEIVELKKSRGFSGDDIYKEIINSSQKSRKSVNEKLGIK